MPTQVTCPHCRIRIPYEGNPHRPFCSERCRILDLGAWANEEYRVEAKEESLTTSEVEENPDNSH